MCTITMELKMPPEQVRAQCPQLRRVELHCVWRWDREAAEKLSRELVRFEDDGRTVQFHSNIAYGTAAVWGELALCANTAAYWEVGTDEVYGTSMMFGVGTRQVVQGVPLGFVDLLGGVGRSADHSYGLSHKGAIFHAGVARRFCAPFAEGPACVGTLFDGPNARIGFTLNGTWLGWAFENVRLGQRVYHPMVSSTSQRSRFRVLTDCQFRACPPRTLRDQCIGTVVNTLLRNRGNEVPPLAQLGVPKAMECELWREWCARVMRGEASRRRSTAPEQQCEEIPGKRAKLADAQEDFVQTFNHYLHLFYNH